MLFRYSHGDETPPIRHDTLSIDIVQRARNVPQINPPRAYSKLIICGMNCFKLFIKILKIYVLFLDSTLPREQDEPRNVKDTRYVSADSSSPQNALWNETHKRSPSRFVFFHTLIILIVIITTITITIITIKASSLLLDSTHGLGRQIDGQEKRIERSRDGGRNQPKSIT